MAFAAERSFGDAIRAYTADIRHTPTKLRITPAMVTQGNSAVNPNAGDGGPTRPASAAQAPDAKSLA